MTHRHALRPALLLAVCAFAALPAVDVPSGRAEPRPLEAQVKPIDAPPQVVADALAALRGADEAKRKKAVATLSALEDAEPYVRHYSYTNQGQADSLADELLDAYDAARAKRNVERAAEWAKQGRYDFLVDVCLHLPETEQVNQVGQAFFDLVKQIGPTQKEYAVQPQPRLGYSMKDFAKKREVREFHKKTGVLTTDWKWYGFVRAQSCEVSSKLRQNWLILTRDKLVGTYPTGNLWEDCYIFHNSDVTFDSCTYSLVVCDGDVEFVHTFDGANSTIITNGNIRSQGGLGCSGAFYFAQGDIVAKSSNSAGAVLMAGGKITAPDRFDGKVGKPRVEKPDLKENPFGVRFFQTGDVGVELAVKDDAVTVAKLTPGSPLTKYGVQVGDVITQVNDKPAKTANDVRRELRYSVVLEAGIFHLRRGDQKLTRVVYFKNGLET